MKLVIDNTTKELLRDPAKRRAWVHYQLMLRGTTAAEVAVKADVSRQCLYSAFVRTYPKMEKVLADALGMAPRELFADRYDENGLPIRRYGRPIKSVTKNTRKRRAGNVETRRAA